MTTAMADKDDSCLVCIQSQVESDARDVAAPAEVVTVDNSVDDVGFCNDSVSYRCSVADVTSRKATRVRGAAHIITAEWQARAKQALEAERMLAADLARVLGIDKSSVTRALDPNRVGKGARHLPAMSKRLGIAPPQLAPDAISPEMAEFLSLAVKLESASPARFALAIQVMKDGLHAVEDRGVKLQHLKEVVRLKKQQDS